MDTEHAIKGANDHKSEDESSSKEASKESSEQSSQEPSEQSSQEPSMQSSQESSKQLSRQPRQESGKPPSPESSNQLSRQPSQEPGHESRKPSSQESVKQLSRQPNQESGKQLSRQPSQESGQESGKQLRRQPSQESGKQLSRQPCQESNNQLSRQLSQEPRKPPSQGSSQQLSRQPRQESSKPPSPESSNQLSRQPSQEPGHESGKPSSQESVKQLSRQPNQESGKQLSRQPSHEPGQESGKQLSRQPSQESGKQLSQHPSHEPGQESGKQLSQHPSHEPGQESGKQLSRQPSQESGKQLRRQPSQESGKQLSQQPSQESGKQLSQQPSQEPRKPPSQGSSQQLSQQFSQQLSRQSSEESGMQDSRQPNQESDMQSSQEPSEDVSPARTLLYIREYLLARERGATSKFDTANSNFRYPTVPNSHFFSIRERNENDEIVEAQYIQSPWGISRSARVGGEDVIVTHTPVLTDADIAPLEQREHRDTVLKVPGNSGSCSPKEVGLDIRTLITKLRAISTDPDNKGFLEPLPAVETAAEGNGTAWKQNKEKEPSHQLEETEWPPLTKPDTDESMTSQANPVVHEWKQNALKERESSKKIDMKYPKNRSRFKPPPSGTQLETTESQDCVDDSEELENVSSLDLDSINTQDMSPALSFISQMSYHSTQDQSFMLNHLLQGQQNVQQYAYGLSPFKTQRSPAHSPQRMPQRLAQSPQMMRQHLAQSPQRLRQHLVQSPQRLQQRLSQSPQRMQQHLAQSPQRLQQHLAQSPQRIQQHLAQSPQRMQQHLAQSPQRMQQHLAQSPQRMQEYFDQSPQKMQEYFDQSPQKSQHHVDLSPRRMQQHEFQSPRQHNMVENPLMEQQSTVPSHMPHSAVESPQKMQNNAVQSPHKMQQDGFQSPQKSRQLNIVQNPMMDRQSIVPPLQAQQHQTVQSPRAEQQNILQSPQKRGMRSSHSEQQSAVLSPQTNQQYKLQSEKKQPLGTQTVQAQQQYPSQENTAQPQQRMQLHASQSPDKTQQYYTGQSQHNLSSATHENQQYTSHSPQKGQQYTQQPPHGNQLNTTAQSPQQMQQDTFRSPIKWQLQTIPSPQAMQACTAQSPTKTPKYTFPPPRGAHLYSVPPPQGVQPHTMPTPQGVQTGTVQSPQKTHDCTFPPPKGGNTYTMPPPSEVQECTVKSPQKVQDDRPSFPPSQGGHEATVSPTRGVQQYQTQHAQETRKYAVRPPQGAQPYPTQSLQTQQQCALKPLQEVQQCAGSPSHERQQWSLPTPTQESQQWSLPPPPQPPPPQESQQWSFPPPPPPPPPERQQWSFPPRSTQERQQWSLPPPPTRERQQWSVPPPPTRERQQWSLPPPLTQEGQQWSVPPPPTQEGQQWSVPPPSTQEGQQWSVPPPSTQEGQQWSVPPPSTQEGQQWSLPPPPTQEGQQWSVPPPPTQERKQWSLPPPSTQEGQQWSVPPPTTQETQQWSLPPTPQERQQWSVRPPQPHEREQWSVRPPPQETKQWSVPPPQPPPQETKQWSFPPPQPPPQEMRQFTIRPPAGVQQYMTQHSQTKQQFPLPPSNEGQQQCIAQNAQATQPYYHHTAQSPLKKCAEEQTLKKRNGKKQSKSGRKSGSRRTHPQNEVKPANSSRDQDGRSFSPIVGHPQRKISTGESTPRKPLRQGRVDQEEEEQGQEKDEQKELTTNPQKPPQDVRERLQQQLEEKQKEVAKVSLRTRKNRYPRNRHDGSRRGSTERLAASFQRPGSHPGQLSSATSSYSRHPDPHEQESSARATHVFTRRDSSNLLKQKGRDDSAFRNCPLTSEEPNLRDQTRPPQDTRRSSSAGVILRFSSPPSANTETRSRSSNGQALVVNASRSGSHGSDSIDTHLPTTGADILSLSRDKSHEALGSGERGTEEISRRSKWCDGNKNLSVSGDEWNKKSMQVRSEQRASRNVPSDPSQTMGGVYNTTLDSSHSSERDSAHDSKDDDSTQASSMSAREYFDTSVQQQWLILQKEPSDIDVPFSIANKDPGQTPAFGQTLQQGHDKGRSVNRSVPAPAGVLQVNMRTLRETSQTGQASVKSRDETVDENAHQGIYSKDLKRTSAPHRYGASVVHTNSKIGEQGRAKTWMNGAVTTAKKSSHASSFFMLPTCPNCHQNYLWPHLLSCFHTLCFPCLKHLNDNGEREIICPLCSLTTTLGDRGPFDLNLDIDLCSRISSSIDPVVCTLCFIPGDIVYCVTCMNFLCVSCRVKHSRAPPTAKHVFADVVKLKTILGKVTEMCSYHTDVVVDRFCQNCQVSICGLCERHTNEHRHHTIIKEIEQQRRRMQTITDEADHMRDNVRKHMQPMILKKQEIESKARACKRNIHLFSNKVIDNVSKKRSEARAMSDKVSDEIANVIQKLKDLTTKFADDCRPWLEFTGRYVNDPEPSFLMHVAPSIQNRFNVLMKMYEQIQELEGFLRVELNFTPEFPAINDILNQSYQIETVESLFDQLDKDTEFNRMVQHSMQEIMSKSGSDINSQIRDEFSGRETGRPTCSSESTAANTNWESDSHTPINYSRKGTMSIHSFGEPGSGKYAFGEPSGIVYLLDGTLAVCDTGNHRIVVYDKEYMYVRTIGQPPIMILRPGDRDKHDRHVPKMPGCLYYPYRLAQCPQSENLVVIERPPSRAIQVFTLDGKFVRRFGNDVLQHPRGVAVDENGMIVVVEGKTMKLMLFTQDGSVVQTFHLCVHLEFPNDIAVKNGNIYISDNRGHCVHVFDYNGRPRGTIGNESVTYYPIGVSVNYMNHVIVTDNHNTFNMSIFDTDGEYQYGYKSGVRHANCYNVAVHPFRCELAVTSRDCLVIIFDYTPPVDMNINKE